MIKNLLFAITVFSLNMVHAQFYEGFEDEAFPPANWTVLSTGAGGAEVWERYAAVNVPPMVAVGTGAAYINRENIGMGNTEEDWLITPQLLVDQNSVLSFHTRTTVVGNQGTLYQIRVATEADPENYFPIQTWTEDELTQIFNVFGFITIPLDDFAGQNIFIAFVRVFTQPTQALNGDRWLLDEVSVSANVTGGSQPFNTISGGFAYDPAGNCSGPALNSPVGISYSVTGTGLNMNVGGSYSFNTIDLNTDITIIPSVNTSLFTAEPTQVVHNFSGFGNVQYTLFCISPLGYHPNLEVTLIPINNARPGFDAKYALHYRNTGNQVHSGSVTLSFDDDRLSFVSAEPAVDASGTGSLTWNYSDLGPFQMGSVTFWMHVNSPTDTPAVNAGDELIYTTAITSQHVDEFPANDTATLNQIAVNSLDPNDKIVLEGDQISESQIGDYLTYIVRFQNLGTAPAQTVVVRDMIENDLDIATFEPVAASHDFTWTRDGAMAEFVFDDIDLADATSDEPNSHGFVAFRIKPKNTSTVGTTFSNKANIYFDYNYPIETNLVETTVTQLSTPDVEASHFALHPNPAKTSFSITSSQIPVSVSILNALGQRVKSFRGDQASFDVSDLGKGIYFVEVVNSDGRMVRKLIKE